MSVNELVQCARALVGGEPRYDYGFAVRDGAIVETGNFRDVRDVAGDLPTRSFPPDRLVVPGFVNGHSHAYQILLRGWADDWTFDRWRREALYRIVPQLTPEDVYWTFVAAFSEMLSAGITTVAEFFYLNGEGNECAAHRPHGSLRRQGADASGGRDLAHREHAKIRQVGEHVDGDRQTHAE